MAKISSILYQSTSNTTGFTSVGTTGQVLTSNGVGIPTWTTPTAVTQFVAFLDKGNSGVSTQTFSYASGAHQKLTITGATTIAFSGFPATGHGEILVELVNGAAFTVAWPTINFMSPNGTTTTSIATYLATNGTRTSLKASGTDFLFIFSKDAGVTLYGKLI